MGGELRSWGGFGMSRAHGGESYSRGCLNWILAGRGESHSMLTLHRIVLCYDIAGVGLCLAWYPSLRLFALLYRGIPAGQCGAQMKS
jgi:hypothetical protein